MPAAAPGVPRLPDGAVASRFAARAGITMVGLSEGPRESRGRWRAERPMGGYYERRWSRAALWCQRLALVAICYLIIAILLHRFGEVTTPQFFWLVAFGLALLVMSLLLGMRAIAELWSAGRRGGKATVRGILLSVLALLPFVWAGWLALRHPPLSDVATSAHAPPVFVEIARVRANGVAAGMNPLAAYEAGYGELVAAAYPAVASRRYNTGAERIYAAIRALLADRGWTLVVVRGAPQAEPPSAEDEPADRPRPGASEEGIVAAAPVDIEIEAVASSLIFGFRTDVAIRIVTEAEATLVDMRSANRYGPHDLGSNARLITTFLGDLDRALAGLAGEG